jgi:hypothetical protein
MTTSSFRRATHKIIGCGLLTLLVLLTSSRAADACSCAPRRPACEVAWESAAVFVGRVERIDVLPGSGRLAPIFRSRHVTFKVIELFRGPTSAEIQIVTGGGGGDCGYRFGKGKDYLVFAYEGRDGQLTTSICARTQPLAAASGDLEYLRAAFHENQPFGRLSGTVSRATNDLVRQRFTTRPASGIRVVFTSGPNRYETSTDAKGEFAVESAPAGEYAVQVVAAENEYVHASPTIVVANARACATMRASIAPDGRVRGRVVDAQGRPVPGVTVELGVHFRLEHPYTSGDIKAATGTDGVYELKRVPPGEYVVGINFSRDGDGELVLPRVFLPGTGNVGRATRVKVGYGERVSVADLALPATLEYRRVTGLVLLAEGGPAADAKVYIRTPGSRGEIVGEAVPTDVFGAFVLSLPAGREYEVFAEASLRGASGTELLSSDKARVEAADATPAPLTLTLRRRY